MGGNIRKLQIKYNTYQLIIYHTRLKMVCFCELNSISYQHGTKRDHLHILIVGWCMDSFSVLRKIIPKHLRMTIFVFSIKPFTRMALISHTYTLSSANTKPPLYFSSIPSFPLISSSTFSTCLLLFTFPSSPFLSCYLNAPLHPLLTNQHYHLILPLRNNSHNYYFAY